MHHRLPRPFRLLNIMADTYLGHLRSEAFQAQRIMRSHWFLHVPKTGGSSVEAVSRLTARSKYMHCCHWRALQGDPSANVTCCPPLRGTPWLLPPDVFRSLFNQTFEGHGPPSFERMPRWCVVRDPLQRWVSGIKWNPWLGRWPVLLGGASGKVHLLPPRSPELLFERLTSRSRTQIRWDEGARRLDLGLETYRNLAPRAKIG